MGQESRSVGSRIYGAYALLAEGCALIFFAFVLLAIGTTAILGPVISILEDFDFELSGVAFLLLVVISAIPSIFIFKLLWRGYERRRGSVLKAEKDAELQLKQDTESAAENPFSFRTFFDGFFELVGGLITLALWSAVFVLGCFVIYMVVRSISTPVAVLIGAVLIGLCILAAARR